MKYIIPILRPKRRMGRLPNDVRTHFIASGEKENALLEILLLLKTDSKGIKADINMG